MLVIRNGVRLSQATEETQLQGNVTWDRKRRNASVLLKKQLFMKVVSQVVGENVMS